MTPATSLKITAVVTARALNMRAGPGVGYPRLGAVIQGTRLVLDARNESGSFVRGQALATDLQGWFSADYADIDGPVMKLPVGEVKVLPTVPAIAFEPAPTPTVSGAVVPVPTLPPVAACSHIAQITLPGVRAVLTGQVLIHGTASAPDFNFYKIEYHREGEPDSAWHSISDVHRNQVANSLLDVWNVSGFPAGNYRLKLTVVDITGNYPPQNRCEVPVIVSP